MKTLKRLVLCFVFLFIVGNQNLFCKDYIVKINSTFITQTANKIKFQSGNLNFINDKGEEKIIPREDVYCVNFNENGNTDIVTQSFIFETIECKLDSISSVAIYFREQNNLLQSINKNEVFGIFFTKEEIEPTIEKYKNTYIQIHQSLYAQNLKILKKDGQTKIIEGIDSLSNTSAYFSVIRNKKLYHTFLDYMNLTSLIFKEPVTDKIILSKKNFVISNTNNIYQVSYFKNIENDKLQAGIIRNDQIVDVPQDKSKIIGLIFIDYSNLSAVGSNNYVNYTGKNNTISFKINVNGGFGHLLANLPETNNQDQKDYLEGLRSGTAFDVNLNIFPIPTFGFGVKYNQFNTSNSYSTVIEDNIQASFLGLSALSNSALKNNKGYFFTNVSVGYISVTNNAIDRGESKLIKGSTVGAYLALGFDLLLTDHFSFGIQSGLLAGAITEYNVNGTKQELKEPDNLLRIDTMLGLKMHF